MNEDQLFRWLFVAIAVAAFSISAYFRRKARQSGQVIRRAQEGYLNLLLRLVFAAPLYLSLLAYMANPSWMAWSSLAVPRWLRWLGAAVGFGMLPMVYWVVSSLGSNISETFLTKAKHVLVTHGPYRWVRHPLYAAAILGLASLSVLAANWFMMVMTALAFLGIALYVVPKEEAQLVAKFGDDYREYMKRTGKFAPRLPLIQ